MMMLDTSVTWIAVTVAFFVAMYFVVRLVRYGRSANWPETAARVESYGRYRHLDDNGASSLSFVDVAYSYSVKDSFYSGQFLSPTLRNDAALTAFLEKTLPIGKSVTVRYNPKHPERSILSDDLVVPTEDSGIHLE